MSEKRRSSGAIRSCRSSKPAPSPMAAGMLQPAQPRILFHRRHHRRRQHLCQRRAAHAGQRRRSGCHQPAAGACLQPHRRSPLVVHHVLSRSRGSARALQQELLGGDGDRFVPFSQPLSRDPALFHGLNRLYALLTDPLCCALEKQIAMVGISAPCSSGWAMSASRRHWRIPDWKRRRRLSTRTAPGR